MKLLFIISLLLLNSCAQLMSGESQMQPVVVKDAKLKTMATTCSGMVEDWGSCYKKAGKSCPEGYEVLRRAENASNALREMEFQCKTNL
jgi:hypothetical protein